MFMLFCVKSMNTLIHFPRRVNLQARRRLMTVFSVAINSTLRVLTCSTVSEGTDTGLRLPYILLVT